MEGSPNRFQYDAAPRLQECAVDKTGCLAPPIDNDELSRQLKEKIHKRKM